MIIVCLQNLKRRKARTFLTVLGVLIGCCSIIIMLSIGIGMKEAQEKMLSQMGDLNIITVTPVGKGKHNAKLNDFSINKMKNIEGVQVATPKLTIEDMSVKVYAGNNQRYMSDYITIVGMNEDALSALGYELKEGAYFQKIPFSVLIGENFAYAFADTKRPEGQNTIELYGDDFFFLEENGQAQGEDKKPTPFFDGMKTPIELEIKEGDKKITQKLTVTGRMKGNSSKGYETSDGLVMRLEDLQKLKTEFKRLQGKPIDISIGYPSALIKVENINQVSKVENIIKSQGFMTNSMESIRKPMEKEARQKQMMLGGLGAISLLVAALGITNTMIMSISERTREIGIMKSLGCYVQNIRMIFLMEAGCIGLLGGIIGILLSIMISFIMNLVSMQISPQSITDIVVALTTEGSRISVIPLWLIGFGLLFSVGIGIGSGYYPANKAVQISALEAIKHD